MTITKGMIRIKTILFVLLVSPDGIYFPIIKNRGQTPVSKIYGIINLIIIVDFLFSLAAENT